MWKFLQDFYLHRGNHCMPASFFKMGLSGLPIKMEELVNSVLTFSHNHITKVNYRTTVIENYLKTRRIEVL